MLIMLYSSQRLHIPSIYIGRYHPWIYACRPCAFHHQKPRTTIMVLDGLICRFYHCSPLDLFIGQRNGQFITSPWHDS